MPRKAKPPPRIVDDDGHLGEGEEVNVRRWEDVIRFYHNSATVHCGLCGWFIRYSNMKFHFDKYHAAMWYDGEVIKPYGVAFLSETVFYALGCDTSP